MPTNNNTGTKRSKNSGNRGATAGRNVSSNSSSANKNASSNTANRNNTTKNSASRSTANRSAASRSRKQTAEVPMNMGLLLFILILCIVIIIVITFGSSKDNGDNTDPVGGTDDSGSVSVNDVTDDKDTIDGIIDSDNEEETIGDTEVKDDSAAVPPANEKDSDTESGEPVTEMETETESESESETETESETESETTTNEDTPVVTPGESTVSEIELNSIVIDYVEEMLTNEAFGADGFGYKITKSNVTYVDDEFASVVAVGEYSYDDYPPTGFAYGVNVDMTNGTIIAADELIFDFDSIEKLFLNGGFKLCDGIDGLLDITNYEDMFMEYRPEYGIYPDVYFTSASFGIIIELVDTLGGYALFEISYNEISGSAFNPTK